MLRTQRNTKPYPYELAHDFHAEDGTPVSWAPNHPLDWASEESEKQLLQQAAVPGASTATASHMTLSQDELLLAVAVGSNIVIYSVEGFRLVETLKDSKETIDVLVFGWSSQPSEYILLSQSMADGEVQPTIVLWHLDHDGKDTQMVPSPNVDLLAVSLSGIDTVIESVSSEMPWMQKESVRTALATGLTDLLSNTIRKYLLLERKVIYGTFPSQCFSSLRANVSQRLFCYLLNDKTTIEVFDMKSKKVVHRLVGHTENITSAVPSPNMKLLASVSWDGTVRIWNLENGECMNVLGSFEQQLWAGDWSLDSKHFAFTGGAGQVFGYRIADGTRVNEVFDIYPEESGSSRSIRWSPNGQKIAMCQEGSKLMIWSPWTNEMKQLWKWKFPRGINADFEPDLGDWIDGGSKLIFNYHVYKSYVEVFDLVQNRKWLFSGGRNIKSADQAAQHYCFSTKRQMMIILCEDGVVRAWRL
ncbi:hypothetical protein BP6252_04042 [Coleophoma cylindrospora]|uniref:Uncharacterized protein n=1 Tax=Coleophoma cylindrospora TaxID=1849047 RepID=A0A3D8RZY2_9HELO|nr:hypothetical protein BP6252_04042 [Coleophoma cylindrospora]